MDLERYLLSLLADLLSNATDPQLGEVTFDGESLVVEMKTRDGETVPLAIHQDRIVRCYKDDTPLETLKRLIHEFEKTQEKYAKFGAHDTEPDAIFQQLLVTAARQGRDRVPREAKGWDLYTCSMDCSEAGAALTAKADEIVKFILSLSEADRRIIGRHLEDYCWRM